MQIDYFTNKIYVANAFSNYVFVIDSDSGNTKSISIGDNPLSIAIDIVRGKIYTANPESRSVSVVDGYNDSKIKDIRVEKSPV
jgi:YVTN family beta-propeller protein